MANKKISALTALSTVADGDLIPIVDISDTTDSANGTTKKITKSNLFTGAGVGDVVGPASATDNAIARFDTTTGKLIQNSGATIDDSGNIAGNNLSGTNTGDSATPAETATTIGALIGGAGDATPNDTDFVATSLTAAGILKKITWTNVKAFLKTYFDTLYPSGSGTSTGTNTGDQTLPTRASLGLDTTDSPQFAGVNLGHATDTTLSRVSAGVVAIEGVNIATILTGSKATTFTFDGTGTPGTSGSVTIQMQKVGNMVTLFIPVVLATTGTGSTSLISNTAIDVAFRPAAYPNVPITIIQDNGANVDNALGILIIGATGILTFTRAASSPAFTNNATAGSNAAMVASYYVA